MGPFSVNVKFRKYGSLRAKPSAFSLKTFYRKRGIPMFLDNLSVSLLQLCDSNDLSYERAAERCDLSSRYIGSIARWETAPSIITLEKLCTGFDKTPNELLRISTPSEELAYRCPMSVLHLRRLRSTNGWTSYPVCPRCGMNLDREYQSYCDRCGQMLDWTEFGDALGAAVE